MCAGENRESVQRFQPETRFVAEWLGGKPISIQLPSIVELAITDTTPVVRGATKTAIVLVVGLGPEKAEGGLESLRRAAGAAARALAGKKTVVFALPAETEDEISAVAQGALLGGYGYDRYLAKKHEPIEEILVLTPLARSKDAKAALNHATTVIAAVNLAIGLLAAIAPGSFYEEIGTYGAENGHYVGDVAAFYLAAGLALAVAVVRPSWRVPVLALVAAWWGLHALNHLGDVNEASSDGKGITDTIPIAAGAVAIGYLAYAASRDQVARDSR